MNAFAVALQTGSIININPFDREDIDLYQFSVRAQDNAPIPRFGFTTVRATEYYFSCNLRFNPYSLILGGKQFLYQNNSLSECTKLACRGIYCSLYQSIKIGLLKNKEMLLMTLIFHVLIGQCQSDGRE
jgi:hypothetical protein